MIQTKSKKEEFEDFEQEVLDAVDEAFDEASGEVAEVLKQYIGSPEGKDKENTSGEENEYTTVIKRERVKRK